MHIGLIGAGRIGAFHASVLIQVPGVDALSIADANPDRSAKLAADLGARSAPSAQALLDGGVDALVIAAATSAHPELIQLGADARLPTFCEKPLALDLEAADMIIERVRRSGITLQIGFQRRFDAGYREARRRVESGALGGLYVVRLATHDPEPPPPAYIPASGGIFRDLHSHDFDIVRWVTGQEVEEVYADGAVLADQTFARYGDADTAVCVLRLTGGTLGIMSGTRRDPLGYDVRMELFGAADSVAVGMDSRMPLRSVEPGAPPPGPAAGYRDFIDRFGAAYRDELTTFVAVAQGLAPNPCSGADARASLRAALAADRSRAEHRPVRVEEVS